MSLLFMNLCEAEDKIQSLPFFLTVYMSLTYQTLDSLCPEKRKGPSTFDLMSQWALRTVSLCLPTSSTHTAWGNTREL